jgi:hypothetical protein
MSHMEPQIKSLQLAYYLIQNGYGSLDCDGSWTPHRCGCKCTGFLLFLVDENREADKLRRHGLMSTDSLKPRVERKDPCKIAGRGTSRVARNWKF